MQGARAGVAGVRDQAEQGPYAPGESVLPTGDAVEAQVLQTEGGEEEGAQQIEAEAEVEEPTALALMERKVSGEPEAEDLGVQERNHLAPEGLGGVEEQEAQREPLEPLALVGRGAPC